MSRKHISTRTQKVIFLARHPELWEQSHLTIKNSLIAARLVSKTTYTRDLGIRRMVEEAKKVLPILAYLESAGDSTKRRKRRPVR